MTGIFTQIEDTEDVRQGDIIRKLNSKAGEVEKLGIVITADCDIAPKKAGERYTWLEIVSMTAYVEGPWAQEQLRKLSDRRSKAICEHSSPRTTASTARASASSDLSLRLPQSSCSATMTAASSLVRGRPRHLVLRWGLHSSGYVTNSAVRC